MLFGINGDIFQRRQPQPLMAKMPRKPAEPGILSHAGDLLLEDGRLEELSIVSQREQFVIRHGSPKEIRQAGGQLIGIELAGLSRPGLSRDNTLKSCKKLILIILIQFLSAPSPKAEPRGAEGAIRRV